MPSAAASILVLDDHPIVRRGLASLIESDPGLALFGEASSRDEVLAALRSRQPDLLLLDLSLGATDGLDLIKYLNVHFPQLPIIVVSMHDEDVYAIRCLNAGARGYLNKQQLGDTVLDAIHAVLSGEFYFSDDLMQKMAAAFADSSSVRGYGTIDALTDRQLQVYVLIGRGMGTRQIAERLCLSTKTIDSHREHIKRKLGIASGNELFRSAVKWVETKGAD